QGCLEIVAKFLATLFPKAAAMDLDPLQVQLQAFVKEMSLDHAAQSAVQSLHASSAGPVIIKDSNTQKKVVTVEKSTVIQLKQKKASSSSKAPLHEDNAMEVEKPAVVQAKNKRVPESSKNPPQGKNLMAA